MKCVLTIPLLYAAAVVQSSPLELLPTALQQMLLMAVAVGVWLFFEGRWPLIVALVAGLIADLIADRALGVSSACLLLALGGMNVIRTDRDAPSIVTGMSFTLIGLFAARLLSLTIHSVTSRVPVESLSTLMTAFQGSAGWAIFFGAMLLVQRGFTSQKSRPISLTRADQWLAGNRST